MKKTLFTLSILGIFVVSALPSASATTLASRLKGRILLQVQDKGQAWYVDPVNQTRAYLGRPDDAFRIMREFGLGITETDYNSFKGYAPSRLSGRILLRVQAKGEAYYVNPVDLKIHYLGRPTDAFNVMRTLGLGITNSDLNQITINTAYTPLIDTDGDGLSDADEAKYGTNPNNSDSDGDGYKDGIEVANGYNPLGSGALTENISTCSQLATLSERADCFFNQFTLSMSQQACLQYQDENKKDSCLLGYAMAKLEPNTCKVISDNEAQVNCLTILAIALNDSGVCNEIVSNLGGNDNIQQCKSTVQSDRQEFNDRCLQTSSPDCNLFSLDQWLHPKLCNLLTNGTAQQACYTAYAATLSAPGFCAMLPLCTADSPCMEGSVIRLENNKTVTAPWPNGSRDVCNYQVGRRAYVTDSCDAISNNSEISTSKPDCYMQVASNSLDLSICTNKLLTSRQKECRLAIAKNIRKLDDCSKFTIKDELEMCWSSVAEATLDVTLCKKITTEPTRSNCYFSLAVRTSNASLCDNVEAKENCLSSVGMQ